MRGMIRLYQSRLKASEETTRHIGAEQEHCGEIEDTYQERRENYSKNIRVESEKISTE